MHIKYHVSCVFSSFIPFFPQSLKFAHCFFNIRGCFQESDPSYRRGRAVWVTDVNIQTGMCRECTLLNWSVGNHCTEPSQRHLKTIFVSLFVFEDVVLWHGTFNKFSLFCMNFRTGWFTPPLDWNLIFGYRPNYLNACQFQLIFTIL